MAAAEKKTTTKRPAKKAATGKASRKPTPSGAPRFAVIGTGRSGTGFVAELLRASGVRCGHEGWFKPDGVGEKSPGLDGDASWLALPDIESGTWQGPVAHVVRHPLAVVRSLVGTRFFHPGEAGSPFPAFARRHLPSLDGMSPVEAAVEWWVQWNTRCAAVADVKLRVEDLRKPWALAELSDALSVSIDSRKAHAVPATFNHRRRGAVDPAEVRRHLDGRAARFGYRP